MSETAVFEPKINETCIVIWDQNDGKNWYFLSGTKVMDKNGILQCADSM